MARSAETALAGEADRGGCEDHPQLSKGLRQSYDPQETRTDRAIIDTHILLLGTGLNDAFLRG